MALKALLLCWTLTTSVGACDQTDCKCRGDCELVHHGNLNPELECKYIVTKQVLEVSNPAILQVDIGETCPREEKGLIHDEACRACGAEHQPCAGQFTACSGCCKVEVKKREHSCRDVKSYYKQKNHCPLQLKRETADDTTEEDNNVDIEVVDGLNKAFYSGKIVDKCNIPIERVDCGRIPLVVDFDCEPCNIGSPSLLKKCCDKCIEFSKSNKLSKYKSIRAFVACQGCQTKVINYHDAAGTTQEWKYAGDYDQVSREWMDSTMEKWIEDNICGLFEKSNPECQRRLLSSNSTEDSARDLECTSTTTTMDSNTTTVDVAKVKVPTTVNAHLPDHYASSAASMSALFTPLRVSGLVVWALLISCA